MAELNLYGEISRETAGHLARKLLRRNKAFFHTEKFAQGHELPKNHGQIMKFRRYNSLALATAPLAEGVSPTGQKLSYEDITVTLEQWGDCVGITDVVQDTHHDPVLQEMTNLCNDQIMETTETNRFAILKAGSNAFYAAGATGRTTLNTIMSRGDLRRIERTMARNRAKKITEIIKATQLVATEPVAAAFYCLTHSDLKVDIENLTDYVPPHQYSNSEKAVAGEVGACGSFRFLVSDLYSPWLLAATATTTTSFLSNGVEPSTEGYPDVYPVVILGMDAYGSVRLQGENAVTPIVIQPKPDKTDPLGQRGFVAWKMWQATVRLAELWMARLETPCTATPQ